MNYLGDLTESSHDALLVEKLRLASRVYHAFTVMGFVALSAAILCDTDLEPAL
jgi:hypothetical protein